MTEKTALEAFEEMMNTPRVGAIRTALQRRAAWSFYQRMRLIKKNIARRKYMVLRDFTDQYYFDDSDVLEVDSRENPFYTGEEPIIRESDGDDYVNDTQQRLEHQALIKPIFMDQMERVADDIRTYKYPPSE